MRPLVVIFLWIPIDLEHNLNPFQPIVGLALGLHLITVQVCNDHAQYRHVLVLQHNLGLIFQSTRDRFRQRHRVGFVTYSRGMPPGCSPGWWLSTFHYSEASLIDLGTLERVFLSMVQSLRSGVEVLERLGTTDLINV